MIKVAKSTIRRYDAEKKFKQAQADLLKIEKCKLAKPEHVLAQVNFNVASRNLAAIRSQIINESDVKKFLNKLNNEELLFAKNYESVYPYLKKNNISEIKLKTLLHVYVVCQNNLQDFINQYRNVVKKYACNETIDCLNVIENKLKHIDIYGNIEKRKLIDFLYAKYEKLNEKSDIANKNEQYGDRQMLLEEAKSYLNLCVLFFFNKIQTQKHLDLILNYNEAREKCQASWSLHVDTVKNKGDYTQTAIDHQKAEDREGKLHSAIVETFEHFISDRNLSSNKQIMIDNIKKQDYNGYQSGAGNDFLTTIMD